MQARGQLEVEVDAGSGLVGASVRGCGGMLAPKCGPVGAPMKIREYENIYLCYIRTLPRVDGWVCMFSIALV